MASWLSSGTIEFQHFLWFIVVFFAIKAAMKWNENLLLGKNPQTDFLMMVDMLVNVHVSFLKIRSSRLTSAKMHYKFNENRLETIQMG